MNVLFTVFFHSASKLFLTNKLAKRNQSSLLKTHFRIDMKWKWKNWSGLLLTDLQYLHFLDIQMYSPVHKQMCISGDLAAGIGQPLTVNMLMSQWFRPKLAAVYGNKCFSLLLSGEKNDSTFSIPGSTFAVICLFTPHSHFIAEIKTMKHCREAAPFQKTQLNKTMSSLCTLFSLDLKNISLPLVTDLCTFQAKVMKWHWAVLNRCKLKRRRRKLGM